MAMTKGKKNIGSSFEGFLDQEGIREEVNIAAVKAAIAIALSEARKAGAKIPKPKKKKAKKK